MPGAQGHLTVRRRPLDGRDGLDGLPGKDGRDGLDGIIIRHFDWNTVDKTASNVFRNDKPNAPKPTDGTTASADGLRYLDFALMTNFSSKSGWDVYQCRRTFTWKPGGKSPKEETFDSNGESENWKTVSSYEAIFASVIVAKNASIDFMQGNKLLIKDANDIVVAGFAGEADFPLWVGSDYDKRLSAPFRVSPKGEMYATKGNIGGFTISTSSLESKTWKMQNGVETATTPSLLLTKDLIRFLGEPLTGNAYYRYNTAIYLGSDVAPGEYGSYLLEPLRIEVYRSTTIGEANAGIYISVEGAKRYDDIEISGNHALFIAKGDIFGFRLRPRIISKTQTLGSMDNVIITNAASDISLYFPSDAEDGHMLFIRKGGTGNVKVGNNDVWTTKKVANVTIRDGEMYVFVYSSSNKLWFSNYLVHGD